MHQCSVARGLKSAAKRVRRSRDEIKLFEMCTLHFKAVRYNEPLVDGWDADIIIDEYKLAILWNGPWHYKQLAMANHSLSQVQSRDRIKTKLLTEHGWTVVAFNDDVYTPTAAMDVILLEVVPRLRLERSIEINKIPSFTTPLS